MKIMTKFTMSVYEEDKERYEKNGLKLGLSRNAYIRFMTNLGEETYYKRGETDD